MSIGETRETGTIEPLVMPQVIPDDVGSESTRIEVPGRVPEHAAAFG